MADVFISYSQKSPGPTKALATYLAGRGLEVWYDVRLGPTDVFWKVIMKHISDAKSVITIWSAASIESEWVYSESMLAHRQKKLVCVHADDIRPEQVPLPFNGYNVCPVGQLDKIDQGLGTLGLSLAAPKPIVVAPEPLILRPEKSILRAPGDGELKALAVLFDAIKDSRDVTDWEDLLEEFGGIDHALVRQAVKRFDALRAPAVSAPAIARATPAPTTAAEIAASEADVTLRIEAGMHTATIKRIAATAEGRLVATGSDDKTVRLWSLPGGKLVRTLRPAVGAGNDGKVYAVAIDPAGSWVAAGGWDATWAKEQRCYVSIFDPTTGAILRRLGPLPNVVTDLRTSRGGTRLAAGLFGKNGIRVWDTSTWALAFEDTDYGGQVYGLTFTQDDRLAATSYDGDVRLYDAAGRLTARAKAHGGARPYGIAFAPDGARLAVGYEDSTRVDVLDGATLAPLFAADTSGIDNGNLASVAWLDGGKCLAAAGQYVEGGHCPIQVWTDGGRGARSAWPGPANTVMNLAALPAGGLVFAAGDPAFGRLDGRGARTLFRSPPLADLRGMLAEHFQVAADGRRLRFGLDARSGTPVLLDLSALTASPSATMPAGLRQADTASLDIRGWEDTTGPTLAGKPLALKPYDRSRSLAILPGSHGFILGTNWSLRRFGSDGKLVWEHPVPGVVWGVNTAREGRLVIAAYGDGTIRWHRADTGEELLAVFLHVARADGAAPTVKGIVAWTPKGYFDCSPGSEDLIGWHVNRGLDQAADFYPASTFASTFKRPDIVQKAIDI